MSCAVGTQGRASESGSCHARQARTWLPSALSPAGPGHPARLDRSWPLAPHLVNAASVCYCNFLRPVAQFAQWFIELIQPPGGASGRPANRDTWPTRLPDKGLCWLPSVLGALLDFNVLTLALVSGSGASRAIFLMARIPRNGWHPRGYGLALIYLSVRPASVHSLKIAWEICV